MEQLRDREKVAGLLWQVLETYGEELLDDHHKLNALLMDYMPRYDKERKFLVKALELGIGKELIDARQGSTEERHTALNRCKATLESELLLSEDAAKYLVTVVAKALHRKTTTLKQQKGKPTDTEQNYLNPPDIVAGLLRKALEENGDDLLENPQKLNSILMKSMPQYKKERRLLIFALSLEFGIGKILLNVQNKNSKEKRAVMNLCQTYLESEMMLVRSAAEYLVLVISEALPQNISKSKNSAQTPKSIQKPGVSSVGVAAVSPYRVTTITFCNYVEKDTASIWAVPDIGANAKAWVKRDGSGCHLYIGESGGVIANKYGPNFRKYSNAVVIHFAGNYDTSNMISMDRMFAECTKLSELDLLGIDTSRVTNMAQMFRGCSSLTKLDLRNFNTSNVTDMSLMFSGCKKLATLITNDTKLNTQYKKDCFKD